jgi:hypothetical protein
MRVMPPQVEDKVTEHEGTRVNNGEREVCRATLSLRHARLVSPLPLAPYTPGPFLSSQPSVAPMLIVL